MLKFLASELFIIVLFKIWITETWLGLTITDFIALNRNNCSNPEMRNNKEIYLIDICIMVIYLIIKDKGELSLKSAGSGSRQL